MKLRITGLLQEKKYVGEVLVHPPRKCANRAQGNPEILRQVGFSRWYGTGEELLQAIVDACSD